MNWTAFTLANEMARTATSIFDRRRGVDSMASIERQIEDAFARILQPVVEGKLDVR